MLVDIRFHQSNFYITSTSIHQAIWFDSICCLFSRMFVESRLPRCCLTILASSHFFSIDLLLYFDYKSPSQIHSFLTTSSNIPHSLMSSPRPRPLSCNSGSSLRLPAVPFFRFTIKEMKLFQTSFLLIVMLCPANQQLQMRLLRPARQRCHSARSLAAWRKVRRRSRVFPSR